MFRTVAYPAGPLHGLARGAATYQTGACARGGNISLEIHHRQPLEQLNELAIVRISTRDL